MAVRHRYGALFSNWSGEQTVGASAYHEPASIQEAGTLVRDLHRRYVLGACKHAYLRAHVAGSGHSSSDTTVSEGVAISTKRLVGRHSYDACKMQYGVLAGTTLGQLSTELSLLALALPGIMSFSDVTVGGAISTASHGSSTRVGTMCSSVAAVGIVTTGGSFTLIKRGDEDFGAAVCGLGLLGLVVVVVFQCEPYYEIEETTEQMPYDTFARTAAIEVAKPGNEYTQFWGDPISDKAVTTHRHRITFSDPNDAQRSSGKRLSRRRRGCCAKLRLAATLSNLFLVPLVGCCPCWYSLFSWIFRMSLVDAGTRVRAEDKQKQKQQQKQQQQQQQRKQKPTQKPKNRKVKTRSWDDALMVGDSPLFHEGEFCVPIANTAEALRITGEVIRSLYSLRSGKILPTYVACRFTGTDTEALMSPANTEPPVISLSDGDGSSSSSSSSDEETSRYGSTDRSASTLQRYTLASDRQKTSLLEEGAVHRRESRPKYAWIEVLQFGEHKMRGFDDVLGTVFQKLRPLGARPHWGKVQHLSSCDAEALYGAMYQRFSAAKLRLDPYGFWSNRMGDRILGDTVPQISPVEGRGSGGGGLFSLPSLSRTVQSPRH
jgi:hypothetical protein